MATYLRKLKRGDTRNKCPNIRVLQGPIYTRAKMRKLKRGSRKLRCICSTKCVFCENGCSCMMAMKITLARNRQYGGSSKMSCLGLFAI